jgi:hypothetical protein
LLRRTLKTMHAFAQANVKTHACICSGERQNPCMHAFAQANVKTHACICSGERGTYSLFYV